MDLLTAAAIDTNWAMFGLGNETLESPLATLIRNESLPDIYDANKIGAIRASSPAEITELIERADEYYRHAHHRCFVLDPLCSPEFSAHLAFQGGYARDDTLLLTLAGDLHGRAVRSEIRPVETDSDWESFWQLMWLNWQERQTRQDHIARENVARQMWRGHKLQQPPMQYWMAYVGEVAVAYCASFPGIGGVGQVENLFTRADYRLRGIAKSLIFHCVARCRELGAGPLVIAADPADTPKDIYGSLGFRPVSVISRYLKRLDD